MSSIDDQTTQSTAAGSPSIRRPPPRPRPRPVRSCLRCRRRKIKCDRLLPCRQCTLTGHARQCTYSTLSKTDEAGDSQTLNESGSRKGLPDASLPDLGDSNHQVPIALRDESEDGPNSETLLSLQQRLQKLELLCTINYSNPTKTSDGENDGRETDNPSPNADAALSLKALGPRYHSQSYKKSLLHHFGVANRFCQSGFDDPERAPVMNELRMFQERWTKARRKTHNINPTLATLSPMLEMLPPRVACDEFVNSYFTTFEKNMRILHYPSFMDDFQRFWGSGEIQHQEFESFVPQLAVIVAIVHSWWDIPAPEDEKDTKADVLCDHVEAWLDNLPRRKQLTMATLRTRALLILAQQVRSVQADEVWKSTGKLVRSSMMAGLHRDPSEFPDIDIFEGELRRKLWMTVVEMDLEASLIYGMPIMVREGNFTCKSPSNVDDVELFDGMTDLPASRPLKESTDSVFQVALVESLSLRLQAVGESVARVENIQTRIHKLEAYTRNLPSSLHLDRSMGKDFGHTFGIVLLHVYIRRVLSHLHRSCISLTGLGPEAITTDLQSSLSILSYQKFFDPEVLDSESGRYWDLFHILCKNDIMQAALDVCLHVQVQHLVSWTRASLLLAIDDTIASLMRRLSRNGSDIKDVLRLLLISQLIKASFMQANGEDMMKKGTYDVLMACRRAATQEGVYVGESMNEEDIRHSPSPNIQLTSEHDDTSIDWTALPSDPLFANHDFASYIGMGGASFDMLPDYDLDNTQGEPWNQY